MWMLKNDLSFSVFDRVGNIDSDNGQFEGIYYNDTRFFSKWNWNFNSLNLLSTEHYCFQKLYQEFNKYIHHKQLYEIERTFNSNENGFSETIHISNTSLDECSGEIKLSYKTDFSDLMDIRKLKVIRAVYENGYTKPSVESSINDKGIKITATDQSGFHYNAILDINDAEIKDNEIIFFYKLKPKENKTIFINVVLKDDSVLPNVKRKSLDDYKKSFEVLTSNFKNYEREINLSIESIHALFNTTKYGAVITAGMPLYPTVFGRDSIISSFCLLPFIPELAKSTLLYLADNMGTKTSIANQEEEGKIPHEIRHGELSRRGLIPFSKYYGSADSSPLYIMLLGEYVKQTNDMKLLNELKPSFEKVLNWIKQKVSDNNLISFANSTGFGLSIQSWKDSEDSMCHKDGTYAKAPIYVVEIQGYAYAAFNTASNLYKLLGEDTKAKEYETLASKIYKTINELFWVESLQTYAMALDEKLAPLEVHSSDSGHLLWCNAVDKSRAEKICKNMFDKELWSGWGIRSLGTSAMRYNPSSYHNGSVWHHDNIICAMGLNNYGFEKEAKQIAKTILDSAFYFMPYSLPELFSGKDRKENIAPTPYDEACRLCGWSSSALIASVNILNKKN